MTTELIPAASLPVATDYGNWPSPFDESGVQYAWDSTSLGLLKTCPRKYQLSMILNWQPKRRSHHLDFGIYYHSAIEHYEKMMATFGEWAKGEELESYIDRRLLHETCVREAIKRAMIDSFGYSPPEGKNDKTRENLIRSLVWYFDHYGLRDPCRTVILSNGKPAVELSFRFEIDHDLMLAGHLDRIVHFGEHQYVMDHKTAGSTLSSHYFKKYNPDNQMSLYTIGAAVAFETPVRGVLIDAAQVAVTFTAFARDLTHRSERQLEEFLDGVYAWRATAEQYHRFGFWPLNETACDNFGGCAFKGVCNKDPSVRDRFLRTDFTQDKPWNPLEPR